MQMAQAGLAAEDEQVAVDACEIFIDLIEAPAPVLGPTIPDLVRWCLQVATTTSYDLATREMALQVGLCFMHALGLPHLQSKPGCAHCCQQRKELETFLWDTILATIEDCW